MEEMAAVLKLFNIELENKVEVHHPLSENLIDASFAHLGNVQPLQPGKAMHGGEPIIHVGFRVLTSHRASFLSAGLEKSQGCPLGFNVRRSKAPSPATLRFLCDTFAP